MTRISAIIGLTRGQRVWLKIVNLFPKAKNVPFATWEEILAYLTK